MDDIRQQRLARFAEQNRASSAAATPTNSSPASTATPTPAPPAAAPTAAPTTKTPTTKAPEAPAPSAAAPKPSKAPAPAATKAPAPAPKESFDKTLKTIFNVATVPGEPGIQIDHDGELDLADLDEIMWSVLTHENRPFIASALFEYLFQCWDRSIAAARRTKNQETLLKLKETQQVLARYAIVCATADSDDAVYGDFGAALLAKANDAPWDYIDLVFQEAHQQDLLDDMVTLAFQAVTARLQTDGFTGPYHSCFSVAEKLFAIKVVAANAAQLSILEISSKPLDNTLLALFAFSPLDGNNPTRILPDIELSTPPQVYKIVQDTKPEALLIMQRLFSITNLLVRASPDSRQRVLDIFAHLLDINHKRMAMQVNRKQVSGDGMMLNVAWVCAKFCEPFADLKGSKIDKIDSDYFRTPHAYTISEETRLVAGKDDADAWHAAALDKDTNFITQIFFLAVGYLQFGFVATVQGEATLKRERDYLQQTVDDVRRTTAAWRAIPGGVQRAEIMVKRVQDALNAKEAQLAVLPVVLRNSEILALFYEFATFVLVYDIHRALPDHSYPRQPLKLPAHMDGDSSKPDASYEALPEFFVEAPVAVLVQVFREAPHVPRLNVHHEQLEAVMFFLLLPQYIKNPYLKSKLVELPFYGGTDQPTTAGTKIDGVFRPIFASYPLVQSHLLRALMKLYVDMEQTGRSAQFYEKFSTRELISYIIDVLWDFPVYRRQLVEESKNNSDFFVRFVALVLNDSTYLLDESLTKLQEIHRLQKEIEAGPQGDSASASAGAARSSATGEAATGEAAMAAGDAAVAGAAEDAEAEDEEGEDSQRSTPQSRLEAAERQVKSYLHLGAKTVDLLGRFTSSAPEPFMVPEIVDRLSSMLNYNLRALVGPRLRELVVSNPEKYGWNPRQLLQQLVKVFLNLAGRDEFVYNLSRDERSYRPENFTRAESILTKRGLMSADEVKRWRDLAARTGASKATADEDELDFDDVPEEFLDPVTFALMQNPVILPTSKITVDLSTIKSHLLSDSTDPFNRQPLKIEDVTPNEELQQQIAAFKQQKRA